ncbi:hypothetical protein E2562_009323 [Oryza meyeriana var. granulata]|uniref:Uncharacterized protein n=1 Tax=Oryza meyeriana var. granulata TaxID=110450 RepID=A0A6G1CEW0_9ORYZ|nr:hypothetical protein E2562_009323 [Oryza meyeriana var. granulata]
MGSGVKDLLLGGLGGGRSAGPASSSFLHHYGNDNGSVASLGLRSGGFTADSLGSGRSARPASSSFFLYYHVHGGGSVASHGLRSSGFAAGVLESGKSARSTSGVARRLQWWLAWHRLRPWLD